METTPAPRTEARYSIEEAFSEICKGNPDATEFCWSMLRLFHVIDDGIDRDHPPDAATAGKALLAGLHAVAFNQFFQENKAALWGVIHCTVLDWVESVELMASPAVPDTLVGHVLKSSYQDVFFMVAMIVGGPDHELECRRKFRAHDFKP